MKFTWFFELFGLYPSRDAKEEFNRLNAVIKEQGRDLTLITRDRDRLSAELMGKEALERKAHRIINVAAGDPTPVEEESRKAYVARVNEFADILEPKFMSIIATAREELDWSGFNDHQHAGLPFGMTRDQYDWMMRGTSNFGKLILDWLDAMRNEHLANINPNPNE